MNPARKYSLAGVLVAFSAFAMPFMMSRELFFSAINTRVFFIYALTYILMLVFAYQLGQGNITCKGKKRPLLYVLLGTFLWLIVSAFAGVDVAMSFWSDILRSSGIIFLGHIGILIYLLSQLLSLHDWVVARRAFIAGSVLFSILFFFGTNGLEIGGRFLGIVNFEVYGLTFGNPTFAAAYILFALVFTLMELADARLWSRNWWKWASMLFIQGISPLFFNFNILSGKVSLSELFSQPGLLLGESRASSATFFLILLYLAGLLLVRFIAQRTGVVRKRLVQRIYSVIWGAGLVIVFVFLFIPGSFVQNAYIQQSGEARPIVWNMALESVAERPLTGWGPENYNYAHQYSFNPALYLEENAGEIWFDRAHNVFLDTLVMVGIPGLLLFLAISILLARVFMRAHRRGDLSYAHAHLFVMVLVAHIIQLQTSFEVAPTYFAWALILGYGLWLERKDLNGDTTTQELSPVAQKIVAVLLVLSTVTASYFFFFQERARQTALVDLFQANETIDRSAYAERALQRPASFETLRRLSSSLIAGVSRNAQTIFANDELRAQVESDIRLYSESFADFIEKNPDHYRARMNYAQFLFFMTANGSSDGPQQAREVLEPGFELSPRNPLTGVLAGLSFMYEGDFKNSLEILERTRDEYPDIKLVARVVEFAEQQQADFPSVTFLNLENI